MAQVPNQGPAGIAMLRSVKEATWWTMCTGVPRSHMAGANELLGKSDDALIDGTVTKHTRALNPHEPFTVPRSLDGFFRASAEYAPIAYICH